jgi:hypothetical protein
MTTGFLAIPIDGQSNPLELDHECGDHGSHDARVETSQTLMPQATAQPIHPEIATLDHGGLHHAHHQRSWCACIKQAVITSHLVLMLHVLAWCRTIARRLQ